MDANEYYTAGCSFIGTYTWILLGSNKGGCYKVKVKNSDSNKSNLSKISKFLDFNGEIRSIHQLNKNSIIICVGRGELYEFNIDKNKIEKILYTGWNGIWRVLVLDEKSVMITGRKGYIVLLTKDEGEWRKRRIAGSSDSNFCLNCGVSL